MIFSSKSLQPSFNWIAKIISGYKIINDVMLKGTNMPGIFNAGKNNFEKWAFMLEDIVEKTGKNYLKPCKLMKSGDFIKMRRQFWRKIFNKNKYIQVLLDELTGFGWKLVEKNE